MYQAGTRLLMGVGQLLDFDRKVKVSGRYWALNECPAGFGL